MSIAQQLLVLLALLMAADLATTLIGLQRGHSETNQVALLAMLKLGHLHGLALYQVAWFAFFSIIVVAAPGQWGAPLIGCAASGLAVLNNIVALSAKQGA